MLIIKIVNDGTGDVITGNYRYEVKINNDVIETGFIKQHKRRMGWQQLVLQLAKDSTFRRVAAVGIEWLEENELSNLQS